MRILLFFNLFNTKTETSFSSGCLGFVIGIGFIIIKALLAAIWSFKLVRRLAVGQRFTQFFLLIILMTAVMVISNPLFDPLPKSININQ